MERPKLTPLWNPEKGVLKVAGLMSGSGTNLVKIIEHEQKLEHERGRSPYHVAVIFSDNPNSNAVKIGHDFGLFVLSYSLEAYCQKRKKDVRDMEARDNYESEVMHVLKDFTCPVFAYAGYMRKARDHFVNSALGVNVHPADLTITDGDGKRKYTGDKAVLKALRNREKELRSSTHIVTLDVDAGPVLMVSRPLEVDGDPSKLDDAVLRTIADAYQNALKGRGDWEIFPKTLEYVADGRFARDRKGLLYFDGEPIPNGVRL